MDGFEDPEQRLLDDDQLEGEDWDAFETSPMFTGDAFDVLGSEVMPQKALYGRVITQHVPQFPSRTMSRKLVGHGRRPGLDIRFRPLAGLFVQQSVDHVVEVQLVGRRRIKCHNQRLIGSTEAIRQHKDDILLDNAAARFLDLESSTTNVGDPLGHRDSFFLAHGEEIAAARQSRAESAGLMNPLQSFPHGSCVGFSHVALGGNRIFWADNFVTKSVDYPLSL